ncbi:MAG: ATP-binding protein [Phycisphaerae bacterium]
MNQQILKVISSTADFLKRINYDFKNFSIRKKIFGSFLLVAVLSALFLLSQLPRLVWLFYYIQACIFMLNILLAFILSNVIIKNIRKLRGALEQVEKGDFSTRIEVDSANEIGQLAGAFNKMAEQLAGKNKSIKELDSQVTEKQIVEHKLIRLNDELTVAVDRLEDSNRELRHLTHITSHDLCEPLRKICCFGKLLKETAEDKLNEDECENLGFMIDAADTMLERIEGIRAYCDIVGDVWPTNSVDLKKIIEELTETEFANVIKSKDVLVTICEPLPKVNVNASQVHLLLRHLISNALEYQKEGKRPVIKISATMQQEGMVKVEIEDNGIGISGEDFRMIFAMFKRLHTQDKHKGAGIGLSLCKKIVERHRGQIGVSSQEGVGTTFWFTLPAAGLPLASARNTFLNNKPTE